MYSSEEECDEVFELQHWNNWPEPGNLLSPSQSSKETTRICFVSNKSSLWTSSSAVSDHIFGNWVPPTNFINFKGLKSFLARRCNENSITEFGQIDAAKNNDCTVTCMWKVNDDWGKRMELNDVTKFNVGDVFWGVVSLGSFGRIKLWVNEYNNLCVLAEGTVSKVGSTEASLISILHAELLRKMLCFSCAQWASLCEEVFKSKASLNFDAFQDYDLTNKSSLDKMWFFICKRRHFLQEQSMLVKLSGAVKCLKRFEIIPKLVVQDIRDLRGRPIL